MIMMFALITLSVKGANTKEVTAISDTSIEQNQNYMADLNSVVGFGGDYTGHGDINLATIQENTVVSRNSVLAVLFESGKDERGSTSVYEVQPGDVLSSIAEDFGLSLQTLITANNIRNINAIKPGLELKIPPIDGILYTVRSGDTVSGLAKKYRAESAKIISFNSLPLTGDMRIGDEIIIPDGVAPVQASNVATKNVSNLRFSGLPKINDYYMTPATCVITQLAHVRNGYDCANKTGTPIYAAAEGTVNLVQYSRTGYGNMLRISHPNGTETLYGHFSKIYVKTGEIVTQGQPLGEMGSTGYSSGPHIHFEIHGAYNILARYGMGGKVTAGQ